MKESTILVPCYVITSKVASSGPCRLQVCCISVKSTAKSWTNTLEVASL